MRNTLKNMILILCISLFFNSFAQNKDLKIGLTLSGGGAKGLAHIGVLKVLEKAGIKFDYITGTSMGSIVGGLYAIGYPADQIDQIAKSADWELLMNDYAERKRLSFEEKLIYQKYILTLPFNDRGIHLPKGMHYGQNIMLLLTRLTKHVHHINDFSQFQIPFKCIAANIEKGTADVIGRGFLPEAIRASMAIPSVFTPTEIDGNLYVDGGLLNNFPVVENKEMGADIVIGVDLQTPLYEKSEITSPIQVLNQAAKILRSEANQVSSDLCDIIIRPAVTQYSVLGFDKCEEIIALGEKAAREALPDILKMLDSLGIKHDKRIIRSVPEVEMVYLDTVIIKEISDRVRKQIFKSVNFNLYHKVSYEKIENLVNYLYGTMNFDEVNYKIEEIDNRQALVIRAKEKNVNDVKLGIHYDTDLKTGVLVNYTSNRVFINELKFQADALISENPRGKIKLMFNPNGIINPMLEIDAMSLQLNLYKKHDKTFSYRSSYALARFSVFSNLHQNFRMGFGLEAMTTKIHFRSTVVRLDNPYQNFYNLNLYADLDSWNTTFYPTKGTSLSVVATLIDEPQINDNYTSISTSIRIEPNFSIGNRFTFQPKLFSGAIINNHDEDPIWHLYKLGGNFSWRNKQYIPFVGYEFAEIIERFYGIARTDFQFEFYPNHYLIAKANVMKYNDNSEDFITLQSGFGWGYGLTYAYNSILGPIEVSVSRNDAGILGFYFSLGFMF